MWLLKGLWHTRCDQKFFSLICFSEIHLIKIFVSLSYDINEGHWECEKHAVMLGCLYKALLKKRRMRHICKMEKLEIRAVIKYFSKKGMPPKGIHEDFMKTLWKESPSYIFTSEGFVVSTFRQTLHLTTLKIYY